MQTLEVPKSYSLAPVTLHGSPIRVSLALTAAVFAISVLSGFHSFPVPFEVAWQFSPVGFLTGILKGFPPEYADLPTGNYFIGPSGWSFDYAKVFFKTCFFESPFYLWCFRRESFQDSLKLLLTANFLTHPAVFFVFPLLFSKYITAALSAEVFAATVEMAFVGILISRTQNYRAGLIGALAILLANLFSWEMGMFV